MPHNWTAVVEHPFSFALFTGLILLFPKPSRQWKPSFFFSSHQKKKKKTMCRYREWYEILRLCLVTAHLTKCRKRYITNDIGNCRCRSYIAITFWHQPIFSIFSSLIIKSDYLYFNINSYFFYYIVYKISCKF